MFKGFRNETFGRQYRYSHERYGMFTASRSARLRHTIGNGLRRVLLSSIEARHYRVRIEGVEHEFSRYRASLKTPRHHPQPQTDSFKLSGIASRPCA